MYISVPHVYVFLGQEIRTRSQIPGTGAIIGGCELLGVGGGNGAHVLTRAAGDSNWSTSFEISGVSFYEVRERTSD